MLNLCKAISIAEYFILTLEDMKNTYQQFYTAFEKGERINTHWFYNLGWKFDEIIFSLNKICEMSNTTENSLEMQLLLTLKNMEKKFHKIYTAFENFKPFNLHCIYELDRKFNELFLHEEEKNRFLTDLNKLAKLVEK
jgi:hypothetical protein